MLLDTDDPSDDPGSASKTYAAYYNASPYYYQVVQTAWDSSGPAWEDTTGTNSAPDTKNIAYAAGRPAAFLNWAITNLYGPVQMQNSQAGMCVQGTSAGGAAAIYSLAWYGLQSTCAHRITTTRSYLLGENFSGGDHGVAVNRHRVFNFLRITARVGHHHRNVASLRHAENKFVALLQALDTQTEAAKLVVFVWIRACDITQQIGLAPAQSRA